MPKAYALVNRLNSAYGTNWRGIVGKYEPQNYENTPNYDILITCVDTAATRREIHELIFDRAYERGTPAYWVDCGNTLDRGQVIIGEPRRDPQEKGFSVHSWPEQESLYWAHSYRSYLYADTGKVGDGPKLRLPCVTELYPDLLDETIPEDDTPSCSMVEALGRQDLFVNQQVATIAEHLLWKLINGGGIDHNGAVFNLSDMTMQAKALRLWPLKVEEYVEGKPVYPRAWLL